MEPRSPLRAPLTPRREDLAAFLLGRWRVTRTINGGEGSFSGLAQFSEDDATGLWWRETGRLRLGAHDGTARRALAVTPTDRPGVWQVRFDTGAPFHLLDLRAGHWEAEHRCGPDTYRGRFVCDGPDRLTATWRVTGPDRDDTIVSDYRRDAARRDGRGA